MASTLGAVNPLRYRGYTYEPESELYYLQSRFYDPNLRRFISPDAYASTGQGALDNNIFAYCQNNPINYNDECGEIPQAVEDKMVHDKVLDYICWNNSILTRYQTCVYYNGENALGGFGFCDLYNMSTGEVWELKKQSCSYSCWTSTATHQLEGYIKGKLKHRPDLTLQKPYCTDIIGGHFSFTKNEYIYEVDYWNEGNGILRYSYWRRPTERRMTATLVVAGIVVVGLILCAPAGVGAGVLAFA